MSCELTAGEHDVTVEAPFAADSWFAFVGDRAVAGAEHSDHRGYRRTLRAGHGDAIVDIRRPPAGVAMPAGTVPTGMSGLERVRRARPSMALAVAVQGAAADTGEILGLVGRLLGGPIDAAAVDGALAEDPLLRPLVARRPGLRVPGPWIPTSSSSGP